MEQQSEKERKDLRKEPRVKEGRRQERKEGKEVKRKD